MESQCTVPSRGAGEIVRRGQDPTTFNATAALEFPCAPKYRALLHQHEFSQTRATIPTHDNYVGLRQRCLFLQCGRNAAFADGQNTDDNFATMTREMAGNLRAGLRPNVLLTEDRQHFH